MGTIIYSEKVLRIMVGMELHTFVWSDWSHQTKDLAKNRKTCKLQVMRNFVFFRFLAKCHVSGSEIKSWGPRI